jgi:hypothetical protein
MQSDRLRQVPFSEHVAERVRTIRAVGGLARDLGIRIAVENHGFGDFLARYMALARRGTRDGARPLEQLTGRPGAPGAPTAQDERLREQQRRHFEGSVAYARDTLGLGERPRP